MIIYSKITNRNFYTAYKILCLNDVFFLRLLRENRGVGGPMSAADVSEASPCDMCRMSYVRICMSYSPDFSRSI